MGLFLLQAPCFMVLVLTRSRPKKHYYMYDVSIVAHPLYKCKFHKAFPIIPALSS